MCSALEQWEIVSFPAIAEVDETRHIHLPSGHYVHQRYAGEALHPDREPLEKLEDMRRVMGGYNFAGQYQQSPSPLGGGMIKENWFKICEPGQTPDQFDQIVQSVDTASKEGELNDYSVCITFGLKGRNIYIINVVRKRLNFPDLKRMIREQYAAFKPTTILIEDKSSGIALIQELLHDGLYCIKKCSPEGDKVMRMHGQTACIENGLVYLPKDAHWLPDFIKEVTSFPKGKFDDQVDALSQALAWIQGVPFYEGVGHDGILPPGI